MTTHYINGTQAPSTSTSVDLNSSTGMSGGALLIAGNLKSGDSLGPGFQPNALTINRTVTGIYAGAYRNVNVLDITTSINSFVDGNQTVTLRYYWDQSTGIMVEMYRSILNTSNPTAYTEVLSVKATETNMWSVDLLGLLSNNLVYIMAGIAVVIVVIAAAIVLRRKKPPPPQAPEATQTSTAETKPG